MLTAESWLCSNDVILGFFHPVVNSYYCLTLRIRSLPSAEAFCILMGENLIRTFQAHQLL